MNRTKYLIAIPCVNRSEKGVPNVIHITFRSFEDGGLFRSKVPFDIFLFESGSQSIDYLDFINEYRTKYPNVKINIITNDFPLDGYTNTHRMFLHFNKMIQDETMKEYNYVMWMDDDILVCKRFLENTDGWMRKFGHKSIFTSLYVCYPSFPAKIHPSVNYSYIHNYYGSCCTIFAPFLSKCVPQYFFSMVGKPDSKFRRCVEKFFPRQTTILVPKVSFVQHLNAGSVNHAGTKYGGHWSHNFIGVNKDPKYWMGIVQ